MKYREIANKLAILVSKMSGGTLRGFPLEGAVSHIEKALEKANNSFSPWKAPRGIEIVGISMGGRTPDKTGGKAHLTLSDGSKVLVAMGSGEK